MKGDIADNLDTANGFLSVSQQYSMGLYNVRSLLQWLDVRNCFYCRIQQ